MEKIVLIDGNAIIHRAFHAMPPFKTTKGMLVNAVYGFASMLLNILGNEKPEYIAVSFDRPAKTFRHKQFADYKATRIKAPQELYDQIPLIKDLVRSFEIPIYEIDGFEADDVLGTLARQASLEEAVKVYIATGDMDTLQLVTDRVFVIAPLKGFKETVKYDFQKVMAKYGLEPDQIVDMKGLMGDSSDNIPGVRGIGPKTAISLLQKYKTLEGVYEHIDEITGGAHDKLVAEREKAFFSRDLARIVVDVPLSLNLSECRTHNFDRARLSDMFDELEFRSLKNRLNDFIKEQSQQHLF
jgi:DNA polymerase I